MAVTVDGSLCGAADAINVNQPCVSVTVCVPGTSNCQTISNLLLDTGSSGLRVFASVITLPLSSITNGGGTLAECVNFADNSSEWGPVEYVDLKLATEPAVKVAMLAINSTYATPPTACSSSQTTPDTGPSETGFNGILGVGLFNQDCGSGCSSDANNGEYFSCSGTTCNSVATAVQVQNPVALLPYDNNGVILELPAVGTAGATSVNGSLILGIGTQSNNKPGSVTTYNANADGNFSTLFSAFSATALTSFIDSGTNFLAFPGVSVLPDCTSSQTGPGGAGLTGLFCPTSVQTLSAVNNSATGTNKGTVSFTIGNASTLSTANPTFMVFSDFGADGGGGTNAVFDWGLPFFFGKNIYVGLEGASSSLGTGMYWAY